MGDTPPLTPEIHGRDKVAEIFKGRARAAQPALVDSDAALVIAFGGVTRMVFDLVVENGWMVEISLIADAGSIAARDLEF